MSSYKLKIAEENKIIEDTNNENLVLISEIDECNNKIKEIEKQLSIQKANSEAIPGSEQIYPDYSPATENVVESEDIFGEEWIEFINNILYELKEAEDWCYSNPKACKDKLSQLRTYIDEMCFGNE